MGVHACTDITGFGLLGHAWEMAAASGVVLKIHSGAVQVMEGAVDLAAQGVVPGGAYANASHVADVVRYGSMVPVDVRNILRAA